MLDDLPDAGKKDDLATIPPADQPGQCLGLAVSLDDLAVAVLATQSPLTVSSVSGPAPERPRS